MKTLDFNLLIDLREKVLLEEASDSSRTSSG